MTHEPVTVAELKAAYKRAGIWTIGMTFDRAMQIATVRWALEKSALAVRQRHHLPQQPRLI